MSINSFILLTVFSMCLLTGCTDRIGYFPADQVPSATVDGTTVAVKGIWRTNHRVEMILVIDNRSGENVEIDYAYWGITGVTLSDGTALITGKRKKTKGILVSSDALVHDEQKKEMAFYFADPSLNASDTLALKLRATRAGQTLSVTVVIPANTPASATENP